LDVRNSRKYLCETATQGTTAHFELHGCAVTSDLQLNKGTGDKGQGTGRRGFFTKIEETFQVNRDICSEMIEEMY
jgi:hypothetical protein